MKCLKPTLLGSMRGKNATPRLGSQEWLGPQLEFCAYADYEGGVFLLGHVDGIGIEQVSHLETQTGTRVVPGSRIPYRQTKPLTALVHHSTI